MTDSTQQHAARGKKALLALWRFLASPIDNPWIALGLALLGGIGLLLLLWWLSPFLYQFLFSAP